ncbi:helix-hairpin-helix domain-containing protein [Luteimicrobium sp. NPDC057192]|uniref:helix-hairpin-helix domain-containing protein n=1 Tax=Luteimicrobium sp. NPDC057192 TaxID=3346042 RepID=UPI00363FCECF
MPRTPPPDARDRVRRLAEPDVPWNPVRTEPADGRSHPDGDDLPTSGPELLPGDAVDGPSGRSRSDRPVDDGDPGADDAVLAARFRAGALGAVSAAYASAHGQPVGAELGRSTGRRRWAVQARSATLVLAVLVAVGAAVATVAVSRGAGAPTGRLSAAVDVPTPRASSGTVAAATEPGAGATAPAGTGATGEGAGAEKILVHVVGAVRRPGLVHLAAGARLEDAVEAAGGPTSSAQLDAVNLAGVVTDGEQVRVPRRGETPASPVGAAPGTGAAADPGSTGATSPGATGAPVDLNTADAAALDALPGVGPVLAQRIIDRRTQSGPFTSVDQLDEVSGIGPTMLARLRDLVRV